jgi:hypothetical protein
MKKLFVLSMVMIFSLVLSANTVFAGHGHRKSLESGAL